MMKILAIGLVVVVCSSADTFDEYVPEDGLDESVFAPAPPTPVPGTDPLSTRWNSLKNTITKHAHSWKNSLKNFGVSNDWKDVKANRQPPTAKKGGWSVPKKEEDLSSCMAACMLHGRGSQKESDTKATATATPPGSLKTATPPATATPAKRKAAKKTATKGDKKKAKKGDKKKAKKGDKKKAKKDDKKKRRWGARR